MINIKLPSKPSYNAELQQSIVTGFSVENNVTLSVSVFTYAFGLADPEIQILTEGLTPIATESLSSLITEYVPA